MTKVPQNLNTRICWMSMVISYLFWLKLEIYAYKLLYNYIMEAKIYAYIHDYKTLFTHYIFISQMYLFPYNISYQNYVQEEPLWYLWFTTYIELHNSNTVQTTMTIRLNSVHSNYLQLRFTVMTYSLLNYITNS